MGTAEVQAYSRAVHLILHPGDRMTWGMWGTTLRGLGDFVERWEYVDFDFEVREMGYAGVVGSGLLVYI